MSLPVIYRNDIELNGNMVIGTMNGSTDYKSATNSLVINTGTAPITNADVGQLILYNSAGSLMYRSNLGIVNLFNNRKFECCNW